MEVRMTAPFVVFGLPRSRTKWLSVFLTYGPFVCVHDSLLNLSSADGLRDLLATPHTGLSETAMAFAAPAIRKMFPTAKFVVVRRPVDEVRAGMNAAGLHWPDGMLEQFADHLDAVSAMPGTLTVDYADLATEEGCRAVFTHCLGLDWNREWWAGLCDRNIQIDMPARIAASDQAVARIDGFAADIRALTAPVDLQEENWFDFAPDGIPLIWEHYREVGSYEHETFDLNIPLIEAMSQAGLLQIVTARARAQSNNGGGKLVGYLVFTITPSLKSRHELNAVQAPFYVKPLWRGRTGLALHRESIRLLKEKGVQRLTLRSGVRGAGERQNALFRRLGAVEDGQMYNLWIGD
jgi:hypothetical protein